MARKRRKHEGKREQDNRPSQGPRYREVIERTFAGVVADMTALVEKLGEAPNVAYLCDHNGMVHGVLPTFTAELDDPGDFTKLLLELTSRYPASALFIAGTGVDVDPCYPGRVRKIMFAVALTPDGKIEDVYPIISDGNATRLGPRERRTYGIFSYPSPGSLPSTN